MTFQEELAYLLSLGHETLTIKLGLRNTELLLNALGQPHQSYESVQIAGTNGKGSTAVMLNSICRAAGIRTGLFTSPHLVSITERIVIDGSEISEETFARHADLVRLAAQELLKTGQIEATPTFFEHVTAISLLAFKEANVDLAILETGLGGRLDATTVAGANTVGITTLAMDHQEYLGETLAEIAAEKAAIIRRGTAAVIAPQLTEALDVVMTHCASVGVKPDIVDENQLTVDEVTEAGRLKVSVTTTHGRYENVLIGLRGRHQLMNSLVAIHLAEALRDRGFEISDRAIIEGLESARHEGRLEIYEGNPRLILDGAHNPSGAEALARYLAEFEGNNFTLVFGAMKNKRLDEIAAILFPAAKRLILTRPDNLRSASLEELKAIATRYLPDDKITLTASSAEALTAAQEQTPPSQVICVTGSLYLVGETKALLGAQSSSSEYNL